MTGPVTRLLPMTGVLQQMLLLPMPGVLQIPQLVLTPGLLQLLTQLLQRKPTSLKAVPVERESPRRKIIL